MSTSQGQSQLRLYGRTALVTGGSRGIGAATALRLAREGAKVGVNYLSNRKAAEDVVREILESGGTASAYQADVTDSEQVARMLGDVEKELALPEVLVLNAAVGSFRPAAFIDSNWPEYEERLTSELSAAFHPCRLLVPRLVEIGRGSITAISSGLARHSVPGFATLSLGKAALEAFVRSMAVELGPRGIRVNAVAPSLTLTDSSRNIPEAAKSGTLSATPLGRLGEPQDIAGVVAFLISDDAQFITGACLYVNGGAIML